MKDFLQKLCTLIVFLMWSYFLYDFVKNDNIDDCTIAVALLLLVIFFLCEFIVLFLRKGIKDNNEK